MPIRLAPMMADPTSRHSYRTAGCADATSQRRAFTGSRRAARRSPTCCQSRSSARIDALGGNRIGMVATNVVPKRTLFAGQAIYDCGPLHLPRGSLLTCAPATVLAASTAATPVSVVRTSAAESIRQPLTIPANFGGSVLVSRGGSIPVSVKEYPLRG